MKRLFLLLSLVTLLVPLWGQVGRVDTFEDMTSIRTDGTRENSWGDIASQLHRYDGCGADVLMVHDACLYEALTGYTVDTTYQYSVQGFCDGNVSFIRVYEIRNIGGVPTFTSIGNHTLSGAVFTPSGGEVAGFCDQTIDILEDIEQVLQGTLDVAVTNFPAIQPVTVNNFPAIQSVQGNVSVNNFPTNQAVTVTNLPAIQPVSGTVDIGNFPTNQDVTVTNLPDTLDVRIAEDIPPVKAWTVEQGDISGQTITYENCQSLSVSFGRSDELGNAANGLFTIENPAGDVATYTEASGISPSMIAPSGGLLETLTVDASAGVGVYVLAQGCAERGHFVCLDPIECQEPPAPAEMSVYWPIITVTEYDPTLISLAGSLGSINPDPAVTIINEDFTANPFGEGYSGSTPLFQAGNTFNLEDMGSNDDLVITYRIELSTGEEITASYLYVSDVDYTTTHVRLAPNADYQLNGANLEITENSYLLVAGFGNTNLEGTGIDLGSNDVIDLTGSTGGTLSHPATPDVNKFITGLRLDDDPIPVEVLLSLNIFQTYLIK